MDTHKTKGCQKVVKNVVTTLTFNVGFKSLTSHEYDTIRNTKDNDKL